MIRVSRIAVVVGALGCGPTVEVGSSDASTSGDASSTTTSTDVSGADAVTTAVADTSSTTTSESTTGEPVGPGCEMPGSCDETCVQWEAIVESANGSWIEQVAIAPDGTILAIETRRDPGSKADVSLLRAFDMDGEPVFEEPLFAHEPEAEMVVGALAVSTDGVIAIVKTETLDEQSQSYWASLDVRAPDGAPLWDTALGTDVSTVGATVAFGGDGSIVVGGARVEGLVSGFGFLIAYEAEGRVRWQREGDAFGPGNSSVGTIRASSATDFVLAGGIDHVSALGRFDLDGNITWMAIEPADAELLHGIADVAVSAEGDLLVAGTEYDGSPFPVPWFGRFAADGSQIASVAYAEIADGSHYLDGIEVTDDGRIFIAGVRVNEGAGTSRHVLEISCDGTAAWEWTHTNPKGYDYANAGGLAWSSITGLAVGGSDYVGEDFTRRGFLALLVP